MDAPSLPVQIDAHKLALVLDSSDHENSIVRAPKLRFDAFPVDENRVAARQAYVKYAPVIASPGRRQIAAFAPFVDDRLSIRGKTRMGIMANLGCDVSCVAAAGSDSTNRSKPGIRPSNENDSATIARPTRPQLHLRLVPFHESARRPAGHRLNPQFAQCFENNVATIGRNRRPAGHPRLEMFRRHVDLRVYRIDHDSSIVDPERYIARITAVGVNATNFAARPKDHRSAVRRPRHIWVDAGYRPCFLHVLIEHRVNAMLGTRRQILDPQR